MKLEQTAMPSRKLLRDIKKSLAFVERYVIVIYFIRLHTLS